MSDPRRNVHTVKVTAGRDDLRTLLDDVRRSHDRVLIEDDGGPVAAIISAEDLDRFLELESERERDFAVVGRMSAAFAGVPFDEIEAEAAKALEEVRSEMRREQQDHTTSAK